LYELGSTWVDQQQGAWLGGLLERRRSRSGYTPARPAPSLGRIDKETLPCLDLHLILDNYATQQDACRATLAQAHPRFKHQGHSGAVFPDGVLDVGAWG
jgi:hypothetical protein